MTKSLFQQGMEKKCCLFFLKGPKPSEATKTLATFGISSTVSKEGWSAVLQSTSSNSVSISISSPHNAVIGRYELSVQIGSSSPASLGTFILPLVFSILRLSMVLIVQWPFSENMKVLTLF